MVKKKNPALATDGATSGAAAKAASGASRKGASEVSASAPVPPAPVASTAGHMLGDWPASTTTRSDEKKARSLGLILTNEGNVILPAPEHLPNISSDNLEDRDSSIPIESRTEERANFEDEDDEPTNPEALSTDPRSFADDIRDTAESNHDDDADHTVFVDAALEKASLQPSKIPSGSFVDEDDLFDLEGDSLDSCRCSFSSSFRKTYLQTIITTLEAFASQFTSLEADKIRIKKEVESMSSKLDNAVRIAAEARQNADSLKEELKQLKSKLKDEEALRGASEAKKDNLLWQSILALLKSADIPSDSLDKLPENSPADALSMTIESNKVVEALLRKNKEVLSRMHSMIFPKASQEKTLEQLMDAFAVDTKDNIEVLKRTLRTYGALFAFQLMM
ncbi:hypothetical protein QYE76_045455 [Lolium multiflorum]|uniref:Uncharacterized protein n=1 Tax=Lolium multiflorum TaxID=4521 RepID=A0AAD8TMY7_LOLMU|nr:hypothetical protein QYE76_045455 [Lolium multiflorum]